MRLAAVSRTLYPPPPRYVRRLLQEFVSASIDGKKKRTLGAFHGQLISTLPQGFFPTSFPG